MLLANAYDANEVTFSLHTVMVSKWIELKPEIGSEMWQARPGLEDLLCYLEKEKF